MSREDAIRKQQGARLRRARIEAGYRSAREAALENQWAESTYRAHESGMRTIGQDDAERYARRFRARGARASALGIMFETGEAREIAHHQPEPLSPGTMVRVIGYVGAGSEAHFYAVSQGDMDEVPAPPGSTEETVAVEIRGDSLGSTFKRWLAFYDDVRRPLTPNLFGELCVVGLDTGQILVKTVRRGSRPGQIDLTSDYAAPIENAKVEWAAKVKLLANR